MTDGTQQFVGTWRLVEMIEASEAFVERMGGQPFGQINYDAAGFMTAMIVRRDRPQFTAREYAQGTVDDRDIYAAFDGLIAYCGTWEVDPERSIVTHHVISSAVPAIAGSGVLRHYEFVDRRLYLRPDEGTGGILVWERAT